MIINLKNTKLSLFICIAIIFSTAIVIGVFRVSETGIQWPEDGARYLNNGAMIRDYLLSGDWFSPYEFAKKNYVQFPGFSVPYHPPGYALMLGIWFIAFGMSYVSGRFFIAFMLGISGIFFYKILRLQKASEASALCGALLMITCPEMVHWGRSSMSEIPALAFLMIGSYFFLKWADSEKEYMCWPAFCFALMAFFCRVTSAGILPAWVLYLFFSIHRKKCFSLHLLLPSALYLLTGVLWSRFAARFANNEIRKGLTDQIFSFATVDNFTIWLRELPSMIGPLVLILSIISLIILLKKKEEIVRFWGFWFISYYLFQVMLAIHFEARYFLFAVPAFFAFISGISFLGKKRIPQLAFYASWGLIFIFNLIFFVNMPTGVTGHHITARKLSTQNLPGNILLSCWNDADLIFRYRCEPNDFKRQLIRGDRSLAIRVSSYAGIAPKPIAQNFKDVENILQLGCIRYMVTSSPKNNDKDDRPADMILAHETAVSQPALFTLLDKTKLSFDLDNKKEAEVYIWRYEGELTESENRLPVIIPTANLEL